uniref:THAP domain-containing protein 11 n=1 Tax=Pseudonaja textilis TaxID=8673 RepID=A0A670YPE0_PSETE
MPGFTCCVPGCYNNSHRDKALHFYTFPKDAELRRLWLKNVSRAGVKTLAAILFKRWPGILAYTPRIKHWSERSGKSV